jgi:hypothetical protein
VEFGFSDQAAVGFEGVNARWWPIGVRNLNILC